MARRRPPRSNLSDKQIRTLLRRLGGLDPALRGNLSEKQIGQQSEDYVGAHLNPLRDQTSAAIERRSQRGVGAISGYTAEHEKQLERIPGLVDADYARQRADEQTASDALAGFLQGRGAQESDALATKLQAAGIEGPPAPPSPVVGGGGPDLLGPPIHPGGTTLLGPPTKGAGPEFLGPPDHAPGPPPPDPNRLSDLSRIFGHGVAGEAAAHGFAGVSRIGSEGASQREYAHELPGIAALGGKASARDLELQLNKELSDRLGEINAQAPGMAADQTERLRDRNLQKSDRRGSALNAFLDRELQRTVAGAGLGLNEAKLGESARQANQRNATQRAAIQAANERSGKTLAERARHNGITEDEQAARDAEHAREARAREHQQRMNEKARERQNRWRRNHPNAAAGSNPYATP